MLTYFPKHGGDGDINSQGRTRSERMGGEKKVREVGKLWMN